MFAYVLGGGEEAETFISCVLERKFLGYSRISLTTLHLVYILVKDTKYSYFCGLK